MLDKAMRAKMTVEKVTRCRGFTEILTMRAEYDGANSPEDNTFAAATPNASIEMTITSQALIGVYSPGQKFYVDFTPIPVQPADPRL